jgi:hypothetical protein
MPSKLTALHDELGGARALLLAVLAAEVLLRSWWAPSACTLLDGSAMCRTLNNEKKILSKMIIYVSIQSISVQSVLHGLRGILDICYGIHS